MLATVVEIDETLTDYIEPVSVVKLPVPPAADSTCTQHIEGVRGGPRGLERELYMMVSASMNQQAMTAQMIPCGTLRPTPLGRRMALRAHGSSTWLSLRRAVPANRRLRDACDLLSAKAASCPPHHLAVNLR